MGLFNLGSVIGAFAGSPKYKRRDVSKPFSGYAEGDLLSTLKNNLTADNADLARYSSAVAADQPLSQKFAGLDEETLGQLINSQTAYDPLATRSAIRDADLGALDRQFLNLVDFGSAQDKARQAALGYGGRASSGLYGKISDSIRAARNLSPVLNTIFSNLGSDTSRIGTERLANIASVLGLMGDRAGRRESSRRELLNPALARSGLTSSALGQAGALGDIIRGNVAGYEQQKSGLQRWADAIGAVDEGLNSALDIYLSGIGGGAGGAGGIGGVFGGGGRGVGGIDINQLMALLSVMNGGRGGGGYPGPRTSSGIGGIF